jgi:hypothetical protein
MMWFILLKPTTTRADSTIQPVFGSKFSSSTTVATVISDSTALPSKRHLPLYIKREGNSSTAKDAQPDPEQDLLGRAKLNRPQSLGQIGSRW